MPASNFCQGYEIKFDLFSVLGSLNIGNRTLENNEKGNLGKIVFEDVIDQRYDHGRTKPSAESRINSFWIDFFILQLGRGHCSFLLQE